MAFALPIIRYWILLMYCFKKIALHSATFDLTGDQEIGKLLSEEIQQNYNYRNLWMLCVIEFIHKPKNQCSHPETYQMWHSFFYGLSNLIDAGGNKWEK